MYFGKTYLNSKSILRMHIVCIYEFEKADMHYVIEKAELLMQQNKEIVYNALTNDVLHVAELLFLYM